MKTNGNTIPINNRRRDRHRPSSRRSTAFCRQRGDNLCGRREDKLKEAKNKFPRLHIKACDISNENESESFFQMVGLPVPDLNILINNAGYRT